MSRPEVTVSNHEQVYEWYRHHGQNPRFARFGHRAVAWVHKPNVTSDSGTGELISSLLDAHTRLVFVANHIHAKDVTVLPAAIWAYPPLREVAGNARIVAKQETFNGEIMGKHAHPVVKKVGGGLVRVTCDALGQIPAMRGSSNAEVDPELLKQAHQNLAATEGHFLDRNVHIAKFGEGTRNTEDPEVVQELKPGVKFGLEAATSAIPLATVPLGIWHPDSERSRVHVGEPLPVPLAVPDLLGEMRERIQYCVDVARGSRSPY